MARKRNRIARPRKMDPLKIERAVRMFLEGIGEDPDRPGLKGTPGRVARMIEDILGGTLIDPLEDLEVIQDERHDEMVLIRNIPLYSFCEHHLLPFAGVAHVAYIPKDGRIIGLSKIARLVDTLARRLQVQERLTKQVADILNAALNPLGVMVVIEAEHLCMSMRGVKKPKAITVTSAVRGSFRTNPATRTEAMMLIKGGMPGGREI